jgi:hypothetical protein
LRISIECRIDQHPIARAIQALGVGGDTRPIVQFDAGSQDELKIRLRHGLLIHLKILDSLPEEVADGVILT